MSPRRTVSRLGSAVRSRAVLPRAEVGRRRLWRHRRGGCSVWGTRGRSPAGGGDPDLGVGDSLLPEIQISSLDVKLALRRKRSKVFEPLIAPAPDRPGRLGCPRWTSRPPAGAVPAGGNCRTDLLFRREQQEPRWAPKVGVHRRSENRRKAAVRLAPQPFVLDTTVRRRPEGPMA